MADPESLTIPGGKLVALPEPSSGTHPTQAESGYYTAVYRALTIFGSATPETDLANARKVWEGCRDAGVSPSACAAAIYSSTHHRHQVCSTTLNEAAEARTREEWEVVVRRSGAMQRLTNFAGRKPDEVIGHHVIFGEFHDDEDARHFAQKMTRAGYVASYGPRKAIAAEAAEAASEEDRHVYRWAEVWWQFPADAKRFAGLLERKHSTIVALAINRVVRTNASERDIKTVIKKHRWEGEYTLYSSTKDPEPLKAAEAREPVEVIHEPGLEAGGIPWIKVERDQRLHDQGMELAKRYGAVGRTEKVYELFGQELAKEDQEIFLLIPLNLRGEFKTAPYEIARGQRSRQTVGVNDVMRAVIASGCEAFIVVHNHPSGNPRPSEEDARLTAAIGKATKPFGQEVAFLDHVVIGTRCACSIVEKKLYRFKA